jgi:hypothetical protein
VVDHGLLDDKPAYLKSKVELEIGFGRAAREVHFPNNNNFQIPLNPPFSKGDF